MGPGVFGDGESRELVEVDHGWLLISKSLISKKTDKAHKLWFLGYILCFWGFSGTENRLGRSRSTLGGLLSAKVQQLYVLGVQSWGFGSKKASNTSRFQSRQVGRDSSFGGALKFSRPLIGRKSGSWTIDPTSFFLSWTLTYNPLKFQALSPWKNFHFWYPFIPGSVPSHGKSRFSPNTPINYRQSTFYSKLESLG